MDQTEALTGKRHLEDMTPAELATVHAALGHEPDTFKTAPPAERAPIDLRPIKEDTAITASGQTVPVNYAVVEASDLVPSQTQDGRANPAYPTELQPRDRSRAVSETQIASIAQNLNPRLLDQTPKASDGAPIISPDGTVESGNGRTLAIQRAYDRNLPTAGAYRAHLAAQGYPVEGMKNPVLVRVRTNHLTPEARQAFTRDANQSGTMAMSGPERAMADAKSISPAMLDLYRGGDLDMAQNRPFVRAFMNSVVDKGDHATMIGPDGEMSQDGIRRVQGALLAKAYGDPQLISAVTESAEPSIKSIGGALTDVAPIWANMREEAADGTIHASMDQTKPLLDAVRLVQRARNEGRNVAEYVGQGEMFSGHTIGPEAEGFLRLMFRNTKDWTGPTSRDKMSEALHVYAEEARKASAAPGLFGEARTAQPADILAFAKERQFGKGEQSTGDLFKAASSGSGQGVRQSGGQGASGASKTPARIGSDKATAIEHVAKAENRVEREPSPAQIEAGNYRHGHVTVQGIPVTIETPSGAERRGVGPDGKPWSVTLQHPYGYVKGTTGADGDHVDTYIGPHPDSPNVWVVDQIDPATGKFDELKAVIGARSEGEAKGIYDAGFSDKSGPARTGAITAMPVEKFKQWLDSGHGKKPLAYREPGLNKTQPGEVGMKLASGQKVLTATGRETSPFPKVSLDTNRKVTNTVKAVDRWLMQNALDEARARGDNFNARGFEHNLEKPSQADKDSAEMYLFDKESVQPSRQPLLRPLTAEAQPTVEPPNTYAPMLRPANHATLPPGVKWDYVETPPYITKRPDLPRSNEPHGVIKTDRPLTAAEQSHFDLTPVANPMPTFAEHIAGFRAKRAATLKTITDTVEDQNRVVGHYDDMPNKKLLLTRGTDKAPFRVTTIDEHGPSGHRDYNSLEDASAEFGSGVTIEPPVHERIFSEAAAIADQIAKSKERAMLYQADAKEEVAKARGLPLYTYHNLPYEDWQKVWQEHSAEVAVAKSFGLTAREASDIINTPIEELRRRDDYAPRENGLKPETDFERLPVGSAKVQSFNNPAESYVEVLREFDPQKVDPTEGEENIRQHPTYARYTKWAKDGHEAPPVAVFPGKDGRFNSSNRRRILTARDAGVAQIKGWFSPEGPNGIPLKYGDVMRAYDEAKSPATLKTEPGAAVDGQGKIVQSEITDAGEKIGGARKDLWAERGLRASDLEGMSAGEAYQYATKDQVWPKADYAQLVADGADPKAVAMVKIIRDRLANRPDTDNADVRRAYVEMMGHARDTLGGVKTVDDVKRVRDALLQHAGFPLGGIADKAARQKYFSIFKGRTDPFRIGYEDERKATKLVEGGFPGKVEPWTRRYDVHKYREGFAVTKRGDRQIISKDFPTKEEAEASAKAMYETAIAAGEKGELPKRPHLDNLERTGADVRGGRNVTGEDFVKDMGFRGVEFGNWVASDERQKAVNLAYDGLHDLARTIGIPPEAISLDGQLGLAFGARGSGSAAAHYEPGKLVINLTKMSGAGALAHEWGHALDHYFGTLDKAPSSRGKPEGASGWYNKTAQRTSYLNNLRPEMAEAFDKVMSAVFSRDKPRAEAVRDAELRIESYQASNDKQKQRMADVQDRDAPASKKFLKDSAGWIKQNEQQIEAAQRRLANLRDEAKPYAAGKINSSYYDEANKLSGKSGTKGYWSRPTEMFARAFESYVFDKINEEGNKSQYLVQGVEPERYQTGYKGNPYPAGMERPAINAAFDHLFKTMDVRTGESGKPALYQPGHEGPPGKVEDVSDSMEQWFSDKNVGTTPEDISHGIRDFLLERGRATGTEAAVFYDTKENNVPHVVTANIEGSVPFTPAMVEQISNGANAIIAHHNHPSDHSLSSGDLAVLAYPGLRWVIAHTDDGNWYAASLAPGTRALLRTLGADAVEKKMVTAHSEIHKRIEQRLSLAVKSGAISAKDAISGMVHAVNSVMAHTGLINYVSSKEVSPHVEQAAADVAKGLQTGLAYRHAERVQYTAGIGKILAEHASAAAGRPGSEKGDIRSEGDAEAPKETGNLPKGLEQPHPAFHNRIVPDDVDHVEYSGFSNRGDQPTYDYDFYNQANENIGHYEERTLPEIAEAHGEPLADKIFARAGVANEVGGEDWPYKKTLHGMDLFTKTGTKAQAPNLPQRPFYSALTRGVEAIPQPRAPAQQWASIIDNARSKGVKQEEIDWSGVKDWLGEQKGPVSKADLLQYLRENEVQLQEVKHGSSRDETAPDQQAQDEHAEEFEHINDAIRRNDEVLNKSRRDPRYEYQYEKASLLDKRLRNEREALHGRMVDETMARSGESGKPTKFSQYKLPGGENYRELLMTMPERAPELPEGYSVKPFQNGFAVFDKTGDEVAWAPTRGGALANAAPSLKRVGNSSPTFRSGHWDEPNILAHVRFDDRTGPNGEKILHMAEIQSDWHQAGRRKGYDTGDSGRQFQEAKAKVDALRPKVEAMVERNGLLGFDSNGQARGALASEPHAWELDTPEDRALATEWADAMQNSRRLAVAEKSEVPNAPFKSTWHELAMKRMLRYAAEHGYDRLSWDTGETNADRYDLSKQVHRIDWTPDGERKIVTITPKDGNVIEFAVDQDGKVEGLSHGPGGTEYDGKHITDVVGKDIGDKIAAERDGDLSGAGLKIGGEGMRGFYDKILPATANKLGKKFGAKVEPYQINSEPSGFQDRYLAGVDLSDKATRDAAIAKASETTSIYRKQIVEFGKRMDGGADQDTASGILSPGAAEQLGGTIEYRDSAPVGDKVHSIPITDAMREGVMQGQPMFQIGDRHIAGGVDRGQTKLLAPDLIARLPERPSQDEAALIEQINKIAKQIVPTARVVPARSLALVTGISEDKTQVMGRNIWGATYVDGPRRTIAWSLGSPDAVGTVRHEVIHWLRNLGFFTPKEWGTLAKAAEDGNWIAKHDIDRRYPTLDYGNKIEEAVAEEHAAWNRKENTPLPPVRRLFARLKDFLQRTRRYLQSMFGHEATADDIFRDIASGKIGKRPVDGTPRPSEATLAQAARTPDGPVESPQEGHDYIDQTASDLAEHMRAKGPGTYERELQNLAPSGPELFLRANWLQREFMGPRTVAEIDTKSGRFWSAIKAEEAEGHSRVNDLRDHIEKTFLKLPRESQDKVNAVMELDRLSQRTRQNDGRSIVAHNDQFDAARGSKVGDTVILNPKESAAYFGLQNMYRKAWYSIMEGAARRMGWIRPWSPAMADNLSLINRAVDEANHPRDRKAFQRLADVMSAMDVQRRAAYMPLMRFGDYYMSVKPKIGTDLDSTGGFPKTAWFEMAERPSMQFSDVDPSKMLRGDVTKTGEVPDYAQARIAELKKQFPPDKYTHESGYLFSKPDALRSLSIPAVEKLMMLMESGVMDRLKAESSMGGYANKNAAREDAAKRYEDLYGELVDAVQDEMYEQMKAGFK